MKVFENKSIIFYLLLSALVFLIIPINDVKSATFSCKIEGECKNVEATGIDSVPCEGGVVEDVACPFIDYIYWTKVEVNDDCKCNQITAPRGIINITEAETYLLQITPEPEPCGILVEVIEDPEAGMSLPVPIATRYRLEEGICPEVNESRLSDYHCIVINSSDEKFKPGVCREFKSPNDIDAHDQARNLCATDSAEAEDVKAISGTCPTIQEREERHSPLAGTSLVDLQTMAAKQLNQGQINSPWALISRAINLMTAFIGSIALLLYVVAGFMWMTAGGASEQVDKAKKIMVWTTLGVVVMLASYMLTSALFGLIPK